MAIGGEMEAVPFWLYPVEQMTEEAVAIMCDADRRPQQAMETLIVRMNS
jgi:hypothetical protein